jgi:hypothetical protein
MQLGIWNFTHFEINSFVTSQAEIGRLVLYLLNVQFLTWLRVEMDGPRALGMQTGG